MGVTGAHACAARGAATSVPGSLFYGFRYAANALTGRRRTRWRSTPPTGFVCPGHILCNTDKRCGHGPLAVTGGRCGKGVPDTDGVGRFAFRLDAQEVADLERATGLLIEDE